MTVILNTGHEIPLIGLGTYKITGDQVLPALENALSAGYRLFDTAKVYANEKEIGEALEILLPKHKLYREDIFITTKLHPNDKDTVRKLVTESLELLKTDYIDMYLIHYPKSFDRSDEDPENSKRRLESYKTLLELKSLGKIRSVGVSSYEVRHLEEIVNEKLEVPCCNQVEFHPHFTRAQLREYCREKGIFFQTILLSWATSQNVGIIPKSTNMERLVANSKVIKLNPCEVEEIEKLNKDQHYVRTTGWTVA